MNIVISSDCTLSHTQERLWAIHLTSGFMDGFASRTLRAICLNAAHAPARHRLSQQQWQPVVRKGALVAAVAATFDDIRGLRTMGIVICYLRRFFTVEYISLYGARFDPSAAAEKGQTIIFFSSSSAPCGRKQDLCAVVSASPPGPESNFLDLLRHFPSLFFLSSCMRAICTPPATSLSLVDWQTAKSNYYMA